MKRGISLIAVLMFMLAATTASIVIFRWIGQEGFASGARLKSNEAYQASQAGLDAVQGWLTNRGAEVGILIKDYKEQNETAKNSGGSEKPMIVNLLGKMGFEREQNYKVYLTGVEQLGSPNNPIRLKFLSEGTARDGSKYTQVGIFEVAGLYKVNLNIKTRSPKKQGDFNQAFYGGISGNTQGEWSSAIVNGDLNTGAGEGIRTTGSTIVTGSVTGNGFGTCGSKDNLEEQTTIAGGIDSNHIYIVGDLNTTRFNVCGSAYVGGKIIGGDKDFYIKGDLYAVGGLDGQVRTTGAAANANLRTINGNFTSCGDVNITGSQDVFSIKGGVRLEENDSCVLPPINPKNYPTKQPELNYRASSDKRIFLGDSSIFWSVTDIMGIVNCGNYPIIGRGGIYFPNAETGTVDKTISGGCNEFANRAGGILNFNKGIAKNVKNQNQKPGRANILEQLSGKIDPDQNRVPDPLELPADTKREWYQIAAQLFDAANRTDIGGGVLPDACIYLLKVREKSSTTPVFNKDQNNYCQARQGTGCNNTGGFVGNLNKCYEGIANSDELSRKYLYGQGTDKFLPVALILENATNNGKVEGNFVWIFDLNLNSPNVSNSATVATDLTKTDATKKAGILKLPATSEESKVLIYLPKGASDMQLSGGKTDIRNYFIFSDGNIDDASGQATLNGSVFLAQKCGASGTEQCSIGKLPDSKLVFNSDLFDALIDAGILSSTVELGSGSASSSSSEDSELEEDEFDKFWIPSAPHLKADLLSKYKSQESAPSAPGEYIGMGEAVIVLPRIIYVAEGEIVLGVTNLNEYFNAFYYGMSPPPRAEDRGKEVADCTGGGGGGSFSGGGLIECKISNSLCNGANCQNHKFYFMAGGEPSEQEAFLSWDNNKLSVPPGTPNSPNCTFVYVNLKNEPQEGGLKVSVEYTALDPDNWQVTENPDKVSNGIFTATGKKDWAYRVCLLSKPNNDVILRINNRNADEGGKKEYTAVNPQSVTIEEDAPAATISRYSAHRDDDAWKVCPGAMIPGTWIDLTCENKKVELANNEWKCKIGSAATYEAYEVEACEIFVAGAAKNSPFGQTVISSVEAAGHSFVADLRWKTATLTVNNGGTSLTLWQPWYSQIPEATVCNPTCTIYQGVNYAVSLTLDNREAKMWNCSPNIYCENSGTAHNLLTYGFENNTGNVLNAYDDVTITLSDPPAANLEGCVLIKTRIRENDYLHVTDFVAPTVNGYTSCTQDELGVDYYLDGALINFAQQITAGGEITARASLCNDLGPATCGTLYIVEAGECEYNGWCGSSHGNIKTSANTNPTMTNGQGNGPVCIFATNIDRLGNATGSITVNGITLPGINGGDVGGRCGNQAWGQQPCIDVVPNVSTADGGYYIFTDQWWGDFSLTLGAPPMGCEASNEPDPNLICDLSPVKLNRSYQLEDIVSCPKIDGKSATQIYNSVWVNAPPKYENGQWRYNANDWFTYVHPNVEGTYNNVSVTATCNYSGKQSVLSGNCTPNPWSLDNSIGVLEGDLVCDLSSLRLGTNTASQNSNGNIIRDLLTCPKLGGVSGAANSVKWVGQPGGTNFPNYINPAFTGIEYNISADSVVCQYSGGVFSPPLSAECSPKPFKLGDEVSLTCTLPPGGVFQGDALLSISGLLSCSSGTPSSPTIDTTTTSLTNNQSYNLPVGTYEDVIVRATCSGISLLANCGTLVVQPISLICNLPSIVEVGDVLNMLEYISCNKGTLGTNVSWNIGGYSVDMNGKNNIWTVTSSHIGSKTVIVGNAQCGNVSVSNVNCGSVTVVVASGQSSSSVASSSSGGMSSSSDGGTTPGGGEGYCSEGVAVVIGGASGIYNLGTGAVCVKIDKDINGWNANNFEGRSCSVNGGALQVLTTSNGGNFSKTSDGYVYIDCTSGTNAGFGLSWW